MMLALRPLFVLLCLLFGGSALAQPGVVESVRFESHPDRLDFYFTATTVIDGSLAEKIPARRGEVLILRLGGITAARKWIETPDPLIKRTLLHPSTQRPPGAILRVRFKRRLITKDLVQQIRAEYVGADQRTVRITVPRPEGRGGKARTRPKATPKTKGDPSEDGAADTATATPDPATPDPPTPDRDGAAPEDPAPAAAATDDPAAQPSDGARPVPDTPAPPAVPAADPSPSTPMTPPPTPTFAAVVSPPAPRTADVTDGLDGFVDRLRLGLEQRPGVPRVAILPFTALDEASHRDHLDDANSALIAARMLRRPGLVLVEPETFDDGLERLHRGEDGRFALDDARALAEMSGADTLVAGSVLSEGDTVTIAGRAIDVATGRDLGATRQPFDRDAMRRLSERIRIEHSASSAILRSALLPGLGQISQGHTGRGAGYLTGFIATLGAGAVSFALGATAESDYQSNDPSTVGRRDDADAHYARSSAFFVAAGAVWLASLVDAIVTSEDRVDYEIPRDAPDN